MLVHTSVLGLVYYKLLINKDTLIASHRRYIIIPLFFFFSSSSYRSHACMRMEMQRDRQAKQMQVFVHYYKFNPIDQVSRCTATMLLKKFEAIQATPSMQVRL